MALARRSRTNLDIWPGFVDALATLLMVIIFLLMIFVISQLYLNEALVGRDEALERLNRQLADMAEQLNLEQSANDDLRANVESLSTQLRASLARRDELENSLSALRLERNSILARLEDSEQQNLEVNATLQDAEARLTDSDALLSQSREQLEDAYATIEANKETIELQLKQLDSLSQDVEALAALRKEMLEQVADLELLSQLQKQDLASRNETIDEQSAQIGEQLSLLDETKADLDQTKASLDETKADLDKATASLSESQANLTATKDDLDAKNEELALRAARLLALEKALEEREAAIAEKDEAIRSQLDELNTQTEAVLLARAESARLRQQIEALNEQIALLNETLEASEARDKEQKAQIINLGKRLNLALASKVQELARYRSEFFGRLREILGSRQGVRVVGDRFVFQSEVLFAQGSAELGPQGQTQLAQLGDTLRLIASDIPPEINWVLRVDGHTDSAPISTARYPSNWELSTARAITVVKFLQARGIPANRLAATGFAEFQPLDDRDDEIAFRRNRRIELKLTER